MSATIQIRRLFPGLGTLIDAINGFRGGYGTLTDPGHTHTATTAGTVATSTVTPIIATGYVFFVDPDAADLVSVVNAVDAANGVQSIALQPDYPRKLQVRVVNAGTAITAGTIDLVGIGAGGQAVTQSISLVGGTATTITTDAYATLTTATVVGLVGGGASQTVGIGVGAALALPRPKVLAATSFAVFKTVVDTASEATGTVDATAGTVIPTSAPNASRDFHVWYNFTYSPLATVASHTHTLTTASALTSITTAVGGTSSFHKSGIDSIAVAAASTSLATSIAAINELAALYYYGTDLFPGHVADTLAHPVADTVNVLTEPRATDLTTAMALANELYIAYNAHLTQSTVHVNDDSTNTASSSTATTQDLLNTRIVDLKAKMNVHWQNSMAGGALRLVDA